MHFVSDEVYAASMHQGEGEGFVSALSLLDEDESKKESNVEDSKSECRKSMGGDAVLDTGRVHVIWSLSKDSGSSGIRMVCLTHPSQALPSETALHSPSMSLAYLSRLSLPSYSLSSPPCLFV